MRKRERDSILKKLDGFSDEKPGRPICIRPFESDEKKLDELVNETGEERSILVRKMIRFALTDRYERFGADRCRDRLDLLIEHSRQNESDSERITEILDRIKSLEDDHKIAAQNTSIFLREIYSLSGLSVFVLNIILTRLIELTSPKETDKEKIAFVANGAMRTVITQVILDLDKCCAFHGIDAGPQMLDELYFATRIHGLAPARATEPNPAPQSL